MDIKTSIYDSAGVRYPDQEDSSACPSGANPLFDDRLSHIKASTPIRDHLLERTEVTHAVMQ